MSSRARPILFAALTAAALGCGPNYRYVYDGESAFERCYGLDYDNSVNDQARASCWSTWLQSYSYGANPDRIEFARNRLANVGAAERRAPSTAAAAPNAAAPAAAAMTAPGAAPLTVDVDRALPAGPPAPEPAPAASPWNGRVSTGGNPVSAPPPTRHDSAGAEPPGAACGHECRGQWGTCGGRCPRQDAACVARCDEGYRDCMRGCF